MVDKQNDGEQDNMVLRTVYFPIELDEELKQLAFSRSTSKGDLIRRAVRLLVTDESRSEAAAVTSVSTDADKK